MRGYPLVNLLLALAAVLALAIPLSSLSRDKETKAAEIVTSPISKDFVSTNVTVKLAHPAAAASLWADRKSVV